MTAPGRRPSIVESLSDRAFGALALAVAGVSALLAQVLL